MRDNEAHRRAGEALRRMAEQAQHGGAAYMNNLRKAVAGLGGKLTEIREEMIAFGFDLSADLDAPAAFVRWRDAEAEWAYLTSERAKGKHIRAAYFDDCYLRALGIVP